MRADGHRRGQGGLRRAPRLFDIYKPAARESGRRMTPGERSLAVRLELLDNDNTLTDEAHRGHRGW